MTLSPEMRAEIQERARRIAAEFPPLTDEQKARVRALLHPVRERAA